jgi:hypothetical protein
MPTSIDDMATLAASACNALWLVEDHVMGPVVDRGLDEGVPEQLAKSCSTSSRSSLHRMVSRSSGLRTCFPSPTRPSLSRTW